MSDGDRSLRNVREFEQTIVYRPKAGRKRMMDRFVKSRILTPREVQVAALMVQGFRNKQIAEQLHIAEETVKDHVVHILSKTEAPNRVGLLYVLQELSPEDVAAIIESWNDHQRSPL